MPLNKNILKQELKKLMTPETMPKSLQESANRLASAYHQYASSALAGVMTASGLNKTTIATSIASASNFYAGIGLGIQLYWQPAVWAGTGFTGVTANAAGLGASLISVGNIIKSTSDNLISTEIKTDFSQEINNFSTQLFNAIDLFTKSITVTATNVSTGATSVVTLT